MKVKLTINLTIFVIAIFDGLKSISWILRMFSINHLEIMFIIIISYKTSDWLSAVIHGLSTAFNSYLSLSLKQTTYPVKVRWICLMKKKIKDLFLSKHMKEKKHESSEKWDGFVGGESKMKDLLLANIWIMFKLVNQYNKVTLVI